MGCAGVAPPSARHGRYCIKTPGVVEPVLGLCGQSGAWSFDHAIDFAGPRAAVWLGAMAVSCGSTRSKARRRAMPQMLFNAAPTSSMAGGFSL